MKTIEISAKAARPFLFGCVCAVPLNIFIIGLPVFAAALIFFAMGGLFFFTYWLCLAIRTKDRSDG